MSQQFKNATKKKTQQQSEHRAYGDAEEDVATLNEDQGATYAKQAAQEGDNPVDIMPVQPVGGAFYLPVKKDPAALWKALQQAWKDMQDTDSTVNEAEYAVHGIQYNDDKFMLARTKLVELEDKDGTFLELNKMEGDGFLFADTFKPAMVEALKEFVDDVAREAVEAAEEAADMKFLDFSADEDSAMLMMQKLLEALKPKQGMAYDHRLIFDTVSTLGHNIRTESNMQFLLPYQTHIVGPVLEILRHAETTFIPTVFFGSKLILTFLESDELDDDLKTWENVVMLAEAIAKHSLGYESQEDQGFAQAGLQVTKSRQAKTTLRAAIHTLVPKLGDASPTDKQRKTLEGIFSQMDEETQALLA